MTINLNPIMDSYSIRAFCSERFFGNPAAVCIVDTFPENTQKIAAMINFSETVFVKPYKKNTFLIRWFSPKDEAPLCGHATIAATYMLNKKYGLSEFTLLHRQGVIQSFVDSRDRVKMMMDQRKIKSLIVTDEYKLILPYGVKEAYTDDTVDIFVLETEQDVLNYQPHFENIMKINKRAITLTARASEYDYVARYFAPRVGIDEDPFCGSINCRLAPYWSSILGKKQLNSYQLKGCSEFIVHDKHVEFIAEADLYAEQKMMIA